MPGEFNKWVKDNEERIAKAKSLPYFIKDNQKYMSSLVPRNVAEGSKEMHETLEDIKSRLGDKCPKTLVELEEAINKYGFSDPSLKAMESEINVFMRTFFDNNDLGLDIDHRYLESVFDKGFLNTFQTGNSKGYVGSGRKKGKIEHRHQRLVMSHRMFTPSYFKGRDVISSKMSHSKQAEYWGKQFERWEYEKYGHVLDRDKYTAYTKGLTHYGDVQVRFKKDKTLATWTFNDSLNPEGVYFQPSLTTDPRVESFDRKGSGIKDMKDSWIKSVEKLRKDLGTDYIELQFHGELTIDAVESLTFGDNPEKLIAKTLIDKLKSKGIELWYVNGGKVILYQ